MLSGSAELIDFQEVTPSNVEYNSDVSKNLYGSSELWIALDYYIRTFVIDMGEVDFSDYVTSTAPLYKVTYDLNYEAFFTPYSGSVFYLANFGLYSSTDDVLLYVPSIYSDRNNIGSFTITEYLTAEQLQKSLSISAIAYSTKRETHNISFDLSFENISVEAVSASGSDEYQDGYNAGYSAGEQAGYGNGYSNGFADGEASVDTDSIYDEAFQAGKDSVDTQSYYNAGYQAGYQVAYSKGYNSGYEKGLEFARESKGDWGSPLFIGSPTEVTRYGQGFYVSSYGLVDMEEYQSGSNGYFYNTVPGTYDGHTIISYNIPFYSFNNGLVKIDSNKFQVDFGLRDIDLSLSCDDGNGTELANLMESRLNEVYVVYNGKKYYGNYDIGTGYVEFDFIAEGLVDPTYLNTGSMTLCFDIHNTVTLVTDADISHFISAKYYNILNFTLGIPSNSYAIYIRPYLENDNVSANIQDQTDKITGSLEEQKEIQSGQLEEQKEQTETQKGIAASIKDFFSSFFDNLINSIIHVIVPTKEEMGELFNRLNDFFSETFGFLYYPFEFIINAFNIFLVADSGTGLTLPAFSIMGYEVWGNQTYDIASEPIVGEIFGFVRMGTGAMLVMWFVNFLKDFFDKRFGGGGN